MDDNPLVFSMPDNVAQAIADGKLTLRCYSLRNGPVVVVEPVGPRGLWKFAIDALASSTGLVLAVGPRGLWKFAIDALASSTGLVLAVAAMRWMGAL